MGLVRNCNVGGYSDRLSVYVTCRVRSVRNLPGENLLVPV